MSCLINAIDGYIKVDLGKKLDFIEFFIGEWRVLIIPVTLRENHQFVVFQDLWDSVEFTV